MHTEHYILISIATVIFISILVFLWQREGIEQFKYSDSSTTFSYSPMHNNLTSQHVATEPENVPAFQLAIEEKKSFSVLPRVQVKLLDVLSDNRCPLDMDCDTPGDATVLVEVVSDGVRKTKEITVPGGTRIIPVPVWTGTSSDTPQNSLVSSDDPYIIHLSALNPYPEKTKNTKKSEYKAEFFVIISPL